MKLFKVFLIIGLLITLVSCQKEDYVPNIPTEDEIPEMTLEELSFYDGREGRPAYIAVQGWIYDVSDSTYWMNGSHNGYQAGQDLTTIILSQSPHGLSTLSRVPIVAKLVTQP
jgi:predicted heme/steroid binding protein